MSLENASRQQLSNFSSLIPEDPMTRRRFGGFLAVAATAFSVETAYFSYKNQTPSDNEIESRTTHFATENNVSLTSDSAQKFKESLEDKQQGNLTKSLISGAISVPLSILGGAIYLRNRESRQKEEPQE